MNISYFKENIKDLLAYQKSYFVLSSFTILLVLIFLKIQNKNLNDKEKQKIKICLIYFLLINAIYFIFIGKHYLQRYALPMIAFGYCFLAIFYDWLLKFCNKYLVFFCLGIVFSYIVWEQQASFREWLKDNTNEMLSRKEIMNFLEEEVKKEDVIVLYSYPCSDSINALSFGVGYAKDMKNKYNVILSQKYRKYLEYNIWNQWCYQWNKQVSIKEILDTKKRILLVGGKFENIVRIRKNDEELVDISLKLFKENASGEYIYELIY